MSKKEEKIIGLYKDLHLSISDNDYDQAYKICDKILTSKPKDSLAAKTKISCFIKLEKFNEAIDFIAKATKSNLLKNSEIAFENAYSLFSKGNFQDALLALNPAPKTERVQLLIAQINYKLENFQNSINVYQELLESDNLIAEKDDIHTNINASIAASAAANPSKVSDSLESKISDGSTFESIYNQSVYYTSVNQHQKATKLLEKAQSVGTQSLKEAGYTDLEIQGELAPVLAQLGYANYLANKHEAIKSWEKVVGLKDADAATKAIAEVNLLCSREFKRKRAILRAANKVYGFESSKLRKQFNESQKSAMVLNAATLYTKAGTYRNATKLLKKRSSSINNLDPNCTHILKTKISVDSGFSNYPISKIGNLVKTVPKDQQATFIAAGTKSICKKNTITNLKKLKELLISGIDTEFVMKPVVLAPDFAKQLNKAKEICSSEEWENLTTNFTNSLERQVAGSNNQQDYLMACIAALILKNIDFGKKILRQALDMNHGDETLSIALAYLFLDDSIDSEKCGKLVNLVDEKTLENKNSSRISVEDYIPGGKKRFLVKNSSRINKDIQKLIGAEPKTKDKTTRKIKKDASSNEGKVREIKLNEKKQKGGKVRPAGSLDPERWIPLRMRSYYRIKGHNRKAKAMRGGAQGNTGVQEAESLNVNEIPSLSSKIGQKIQSGQKPKGAKNKNKKRR
ncbi:hypothetical protein BB559_003707 [Furculomyces boomerangus]|uniref:Signal recognition particle subunit SRP72 n=1 Tax=Furculomyces boomerangus TaxID=61424 RepID=A0A2T9YJH3_9FUNG|nr:hypothetical protein BB559_003707 [Furculomyces boomerangus]